MLMLVMITCKNSKKDEIEKFQKKRDNIINVKGKINDLKTELVFGYSSLYICDNLLIVMEMAPGGNKGIHLYDKNTFEYITSSAIIGKGPGEVARQGGIGFDSKDRVLWVSDHGKKLIWKFPLDSILNNEMYKPTEKINLFDELFIEKYGFVNDSIAIGKAVRIHPNYSFDKVMAKLNINNNVTEEYGYEHPEATAKKSISVFKLSTENNFYVNCYFYCDLMTICDLEGNLKKNIYGPGWLKNKDNRNAYFTEVDLYNKYIIAAYLGDESIIFNENKRPQSNLPSKFLVFDLDGEYQKTIDTGHKIAYFCIDSENKRLIAYFDDRENPLGYIDLQEILN